MVEQKIRRANVQANGLNLFYRDTGKGEKTMLCLHGRWGRGETWTDFISLYRDRYRIIAPDQRGHGLSDRPVARYDKKEMARDMYELMRSLDIGEYMVVGHSMGGTVAAHLAAIYPDVVKAAAILDSTAEGPVNPSDVPPEEVEAKDALTEDWPTPYSTYNDAVRHLEGLFGPSGVRYFSESLIETTTGYDFLFSRYSMAAIEQYSCSWFDILLKIRCPVLLVRATESWCLSREAAEKMRSCIKDCTYFEVSKSDHMVYADNLDEFYSGFEKFLDKVEEG
jgi:2-succinyl-6-hydroxy-2,4-cyclohexadiene-1-carboxylate synthase